ARDALQARASCIFRAQKPRKTHQLQAVVAKALRLSGALNLADADECDHQESRYK
ncbi:hypothetical protein HUJ04_000382, partial [Dendroctonus ponderosae]